MAPEIVLKKEYCGPPVDIYASGILLFAMFNGCFPFKGSNDKELYKCIVKGNFNIPDYVPSGPRSILSKIIIADPNLRPTAKQLFNDPWLAIGPNE